MRPIPSDLPEPIRAACEPFRALPRAPGATWEQHTPEQAWEVLRSKRAMHAVKWPKLVAGTPRAEHVPSLLARFDSPSPPRELLAPEVEATWLWLETVKSGKPSDAGELIVDVWAMADPSSAVANLVAFASLPDRGGASIEEPRRLRAHLSVTDASWSGARDRARELTAGASSEVAALTAYLFPEDDAVANAAAKKVKTPKGYEHLLALATTDAKALASIVKKAGNAWGLMRLHGVVPAWAVVALGAKSLPILEILGKRWPDHVAAELAHVATLK